MNQNKLKYHQAWLEYGFINEAELINQISEFETGEDPNTEHYRYKSFLNFIEERKKFEDDEITNFIKLVDLDTHKGMASSALVQLFRSQKLTVSQIKTVGGKLITYGDWARKIVNRELAENLDSSNQKVN